MIHIDRSKLPSPGVIESKRFKRLIERLLKEKIEHDFEKHRTHYIKKLSEGLKNLYKNKCGYCETRLSAGSDIQIDHYRPKGELKGDESHPGYYWLFYEWTNLVPVCSKCNRAKSTYFPIDTSDGKRVTEPPMDGDCLDMEACRVDSEIHIAEKPLLLHPEVDRPEEHLIFLPNGEIEGKSLKGETTVKICKLDRPGLVIARKGVIDRLFKAVATHLRQFSKKEIKKETLFYGLNNEFTKIKRARESHHSYSRLGWYLFEEFDTFFIQPLKAASKNESVQLLGEAFLLFCEKGNCLIPNKK
ncbi:MAG: hypothetical protein GTO45_40255 [Candidatus Aminicenantes bacterium]|nr:hypothetical protein [Candidatus Aminicenantes bacterium]NIM84847.1 hypothetical protein [Candidatus Aminicenantes bacterium]NIN24355.1 hypothetical protein [Candidatus Aminicenantes bacterium]NIN48119.1 hypothetical protein [Candidatus Aminicenantes bacterium]NIN91017.1 hypothetical protein [Candidatus Aminicenantes bacterium]